MSRQKTTTYQHDPVIIVVLKQIRDRVEGLGLGGKERDKDALAFILGAACGLIAVGDKRGSTLLKLGSLVVALQGYKAIEAMLVRDDGREQEDKAAGT